MAEKRLLTEDEAIELFAFLITSARTQLEDPVNYGPMRLLTAAEKLRDLVAEKVSPAAQAMLAATVDKSERAQIIMNDPEAFAEALDELCVLVAEYLVRQGKLEVRPT